MAKKQPYLVFYIEADHDSEVAPHTCGGDWIASATSKQDALNQSKSLIDVDESRYAYVIPIDFCTKFERTVMWKQVSKGTD